ncbi:hypothetical protein CRG98_020693, partial [Punica granatum]
VGAANRLPRPLHRGRRYSQRIPVTSVERSGSLIGGFNPESIEDSESEVPGRFGVGAANRRPRPLHQGRRCPPWVWLPIGDPDLSTEVASVLRGYRRPRSIRGWGRQSATLTPPLRSPASSVGIGDVGGEAWVSDWRL